MCKWEEWAVFALAQALQTHPTLFIHSANQSTTQWLGFTHNATNGVISVGTGNISLLNTLAPVAGTTTVAPIQLTSGTLLTTPIVGAVEFLTDKGYLTITTGTARKELTLNDAALSSGKIPIATTNGRLTDLTASAAYTPTNVTTDRSYDADLTTVDELADVLGTLIADLKAVNILS